MLIKLDMQSRQPIYEQLITKIGEMVLMGQLSQNDQLPSVRSLARDLGVNPNTVQKAYQDLERDGVIYSLVGKGSFISGRTEVIAHLQERQLMKVTQAVLQAKACGIGKDKIQQCVERVYDTDLSREAQEKG